MPKGLVVIAVDRCKGCCLCAHVCPSHILTLSPDTFNAKGYHPVTIVDAEKCIGCASCARICPDVVFTVYRQKREGRRVATPARIATPTPVAAMA